MIGVGVGVRIKARARNRGRVRAHLHLQVVNQLLALEAHACGGLAIRLAPARSRCDTKRINAAEVASER